MKSDRMATLTKRPIFSLFFTAGYPKLGDTRAILKSVQDSGVDMVEIGFPFSDPVADGPTIQASNEAALTNGMNVSVLFEQLRGMRSEITIPVLLMGYLNPMLQYGVERFVAQASDVGIDALIVPDMPFEQYLREYRATFEDNGVRPVFLITRRTSDERIRRFDDAGPAFLYVVSSDAITGGRAEIDSGRNSFFERLSAMKLSSKLVVGFGVADKSSFDVATRHTDGAIVGSAFLRSLDAVAGDKGDRTDAGKLTTVISQFVAQFR